MPELEVYLDNAATTRTDRDLAEAVARDMVELYANPSSAHRLGLAAGRRLAEARREVEGLFGDRRCVFTASGSEALNLALKGAFLCNRKGENHPYAREGKARHRILFSAVEHPAVANGAASLIPLGARPEKVAVEATGRIDLAALEAALRAEEDTVAVVAVMHVQNELGTVQPVAEVGALVARLAPKATFLVDAVQGLGKLPVDPAGWRAHAVAVASHKVHGPKGVGALLLAKNTPLEPLVSGGGQEGGLRSGTENVAGVAAFAAALTRAVRGLEANRKTMSALRDRLRAAILAKVDDVAENSPAENGSPAILNLSFRGVPSEVLLHALETDGVYVSAGSACHSKGKPHNAVHAAVKLPEWRSLSAIRFGLSWHTTEAEVDRAAACVARRVAELRKALLAKV